MNRITGLAALFAAALLTAPAQANLVLFNNGTGFGLCQTLNCDSFMDMDGTGFGRDPRLLTMQTTGSEIGANAPGAGGTIVGTGAAISGADKAATPSLSGLGWDAGSKVAIAMVIDQTGNSGITLNSLSLNVYSGTTLLHTFSTAGADVYTAAELGLQPGNGNAAFVFILDAAQRAIWDGLNFAMADVIGLSASVSGANDGPDSFIALSRPGAPLFQTPLPAAAWLFGSGLVGLIAVGRKRRKMLTGQPA